MRVTQIMLSKGFGGAERHFVDLSLELAARGNAVQVICQPKFAETKKLLGIGNLSIAPLPVLGTWDPLATWRLGRLLRSFQPDIVHTHLARAAALASQVVGRENLPLVANTHNYVNLKYYQGVDRFVVPTTAQQDYLRAQGIGPEQIVLIPHFCRLPITNSRSSEARATFVTLGRMVKKKGFDTLIEAFYRLRQKDATATLIIGGTGPEYTALTKQVHDLQLDDVVRFPGWIDSIPDFLDQGAIFVLPSLDEPFGIVVLEAMARRLPIISSRTDGPCEILGESSAYLVGVGDTSALAGAMQQAIEDEVERERKASTAAQLYSKKYTKEAVIPQYEQLYQSIV